MKHIKTYEEKETIYKIYCDMDGVLTNFDKSVYDGVIKDWNKKYNTNYVTGWNFEDGEGTDIFWKEIKKLGPEFWFDMPWKNDGKKLWDYIKSDTTEILTKPAKPERSNSCIPGKLAWCKRELGEDVKVNIDMNKSIYAKPNHILIDDLEENINKWIKAGGIGILHIDTETTIKELEKIIK